MKDSMIDMMVMMMPYMKPFMWIGVVAVVAGILLVIANLVFKSNTLKASTLLGRVVFGVSVFFIAAQLAGYFLNMPPTINFGDSSKFEFILVSFWKIGAAFFIAGLIIKFSRKSNNTTAS
ncbi:hypothetical protein MNBD_GAMMA08-2405 [hydrothermal vent metagenome]|uniref:Uncharacterized protein n=1 Tax=hydrothermal vent metagenome TaxID=652676 RepID=A0A3B0XQU6_9ZZZZ